MSLLNKITFLGLICLLVAVGGVIATEEDTYLNNVNLGYNAEMYPLLAAGVDPNYIEFLNVTGGPQFGIICFRISNPSTLVVGGAPGKAVQNVTFCARSQQTSLSLSTFKNIASPQATGIIYDVVITGTWKGRSLKMSIGYMVDVIRGPATSYVSTSATFLGTLDTRHIEFVGKIMGITKISYRLPTGINRQLLALYGDIDTSNATTSIMLGYSSISPYASNCTIASPAPHYIHGNASNFALEDGLFHADNVNVSDEFGTLVLNGAQMEGYGDHLVRGDRPLIYSSYAMVTATNGVRYLATSLSISATAYTICI